MNKLFDYIYQELCCNSESLFENAKDNFLEHGRGVMFCIINSVADAMHAKEYPVMFAPKEALNSSGYEDAIKMMEEYNPNKEFVLIISIVMDKKARYQNNNDSLMKVYAIPHDMHKHIAPKFGKELEIQKCKSKSLIDVDPYVSVCSYCQNPANCSLLQCSACHSAKYCDKECQKKHWKDHKIMCAQMKKIKQDGMDKFNK